MRSFVLILIVLASLLNVESQGASTNENPQPIRNQADSNPPSPRPGGNTQPEKSHSAKAKEARQDNQRGTKERPVFVEIVQGPSTTQHTEKKAEEGKEKPPEDKTVEKWSATINAGAAVIVAVFTGFLWWTAKRQWKATQDAATAALKNTEALISSERAWVAVSKIKMSPERFTDVSVRAFQVSITYINYGRTVARLRSTFHGRFHMINDWNELPPSPQYPPLTSEARHTSTYLKPNETMTSDAILLDPIKPTSEQLTDIGSGKIKVILYAQITYFDFADQERSTQFCYEWVPLTETWEVSGPRSYNVHT